jgi:protein involved in polysaccharide export with SLBB domain
MPDRLLLALIVAATCWSLSTHGNAQIGLPGMRPPLSSQAGSSGQEVRVAHPPAAYAAQPSVSFGESSVAIADPSRKLQAGDQLLLKIEQDHEGAIPVLVSTTGEVVVDPIPQTIRVSGLTLSQATNEIKRLLEKDYYYTATVRLTLERASNPVAGSINLDGEVARKGAMPLYEGRPLKLSRAINNAGGFTGNANERKVKVTRTNKNGTTEVFVVDIKAVTKESQVEKDLLLQDGDYILVPGNFVRNY